MNGAESLVRTLVKGGVEVCFANPGTSEMHFVGALDRVEGMRCVLGLFEGVCSGAADGYYRMTDKPASTLLHLGPGLANAAANLHNAKKAGSGVVNIVGEHALYHIKYDTPLTADIEGIARPFSHWVKTSPTSKTVASDGALAIQAARVAPGQIATLILPADTAWGEADGMAETPATAAPDKPTSDTVVAAAKALKMPNAMLFIGGRALRARGLELAQTPGLNGPYWHGPTMTQPQRGMPGKPPMPFMPPNFFIIFIMPPPRIFFIMSCIWANSLSKRLTSCT